MIMACKKKGRKNALSGLAGFYSDKLNVRV
jgi:hypothetical protein